jgi:hypothetical protein
VSGSLEPSRTPLTYVSQANTKNESARPANLSIITPDPTPSPNKTTAVQAQGSKFPNAKDLQSPVSPITNDNARRPFSYEAIAQQPQRPQEQLPPRAESAQSYQSASPISPAAATITFPPRSTSRPQQPKPFAEIQQQQTSRSPSPDSLNSPPSPPNIVKPSPSTAAAITDKHLSCYAQHASYVWSKNDCQPMACMVCHENDRERKWACTWCYLRVCLACSDELMRTPGRDLRAVMEKKDLKSEGMGERGARAGTARYRRW